MQKLWDHCRDTPLPEGKEEEADDAGFFCLQEGDMVFARDMFGSGRMEDDVIQYWWSPKDQLPLEERSAFTDARALGLGSRELRTASKPELVDGSWTGGVAWERDTQAKPISGSARCYTLRQSYESQKNLSAPVPGAKIFEECVNEHQKMCKTIIQASSHLAMSAFKHAPPYLKQALKCQADVTNLPPLGHSGNYAFPMQQINISATKPSNTLAIAHFKGDLGKFAGKHIDHQDAPEGVTCMHSHSDLDEDDHPGLFYLPEIGAYMVMRGMISVCFSGLRFHGGTPPTSPSDREPSPYSYRIVVVNYPPSALINADGLVGFTSMPNGSLLSLRPEMRDLIYNNPSAFTFSNHGNWGTDGLALTEHCAMFNWYARAMAQFSAYLLRGLPSSLAADFYKA
ncbi:hypothetical protein SCP_0802580 [Sparassis crispa]|uniref:Uncharacterized protein n=1 Tax=Sparassis crispa TaxID=139825 RepID=A0A401GU52_9APHY|nr:hypothetical protein SCP_0802580 [Sparassis crispa]GBE85736.1 hypothetical protein SCP_0802580 [Sparassis crispa]